MSMCLCASIYYAMLCYKFQDSKLSSHGVDFFEAKKKQKKHTLKRIKNQKIKTSKNQVFDWDLGAKRPVCMDSKIDI